MTQTNSIPKLAGSAGSLLGVVGLLMYLSGVFSLGPRMFLLVGVSLIALAFVAFFVEEFGPRR